MKRLRKSVFGPPFLLLFMAVVASFHDPKGFLAWTKTINTWILDHLGWLFSATSLWMVLLCVAVYFSRFGQIRIGGDDAEPLLTRWQWFAITLCTTVAIGILFWATAEPLYHLRTPPKSLGMAANSPQAAQFAMSTMYMHWTFTPYAIYTIPSLMFAYAFYNRKESYSLQSTLTPLLGKRKSPWLGNSLDAICLYSLVLGMAASLGTGIITLAGGLGYFFGWKSTPGIYAFIAALIVIAFCLSAASGLLKGIRLLSDWNVRIFVGLCIIVFLSGPTSFVLQFGSESFGQYMNHFFERSLFIGSMPKDPWPQSWSVFYWAVWMAWAPITAMFLGRIARGYTVREFIVFNWVLPSLFSVVWMAIFSGTTIHMELVQKLGFQQVLSTKGPNSVIYALFSQMPLATVLIAVFIGVSFLSYVTAADSNTSAMAALCTTGITADSSEAPFLPKLLWGGTVGLVAWVMTSYAGIDGIKMLSNIGGLPALFLLIAISVALFLTVLRYQNEWDDSSGNPIDSDKSSSL
ncbi:MAG: BCCT family transporter [Deltaproteobacteria bacterium]|nr:MAG: BCCT family transporter [Deltaproteobacteria bacterium]